MLPYAATERHLSPLSTPYAPPFHQYQSRPSPVAPPQAQSAASMCICLYDVTLYSCGHTLARINQTEPCSRAGSPGHLRSNNVSGTSVLQNSTNLVLDNVRCPDHGRRARVGGQHLFEVAVALGRLLQSFKRSVEQLALLYATSTGVTVRRQEPSHTVLTTINQLGGKWESSMDKIAFFAPVVAMNAVIQRIRYAADRPERWHGETIPGFARAVSAKNDLDARFGTLRRQVEDARVQMGLQRPASTINKVALDVGTHTGATNGANAAVRSPLSIEAHKPVFAGPVTKDQARDSEFTQRLSSPLDSLCGDFAKLQTPSGTARGQQKPVDRAGLNIFNVQQAMYDRSELNPHSDSFRPSCPQGQHFTPPPKAEHQQHDLQRKLASRSPSSLDPTPAQIPARSSAEVRTTSPAPRKALSQEPTVFETPRPHTEGSLHENPDTENLRTMVYGHGAPDIDPFNGRPQPYHPHGVKGAPSGSQRLHSLVYGRPPAWMRSPHHTEERDGATAPPTNTTPDFFQARAWAALESPGQTWCQPDHKVRELKRIWDRLPSTQGRLGKDLIAEGSPPRPP